MRLRSIFRESWRNILSGTSRTVTLFLVLTVAGIAAGWADIVVVSRLEQEAQDFQRSGASILTVTAPGRVDGNRCESLSSIPGVRAAGALSTPVNQYVTTISLPGSPIPLGYASKGFPEVVRAATDGGTGLLLSDEAANILGAAEGSRLRTTSGTTRVAGVYDYPRDGRRNGYGYLALEIVDSEKAFDECWVDIWPQDSSIQSSLLMTVLPAGASSDEQPEVAQLNSSRGREFEGYTQYRERITRFGGSVVGLFALAMSFALLRSRRVELASALHDQMSKIDLWAVAAIESLLWVAPAAALSTVSCALFFAARGESGIGLVLGLRIAVSLALGASIGVLLALSLTREKDLFVFAKDR